MDDQEHMKTEEAIKNGWSRAHVTQDKERRQTEYKTENYTWDTRTP